ncbi:MAG: glycerol kinase GlpK [Steroidobacteraceae bacterium]
MQARCVAALDQGTTSTRCILFDTRGDILALARREHAQHFPQPGWVEHDAGEIWRNAQAVLAEALSMARLGPREVAALGITNQRETTLLWNRRTGEPLHPALVWQDTRVEALAAAYRRDENAARIQSLTGLPLASYFSALKIQWLLDSLPGARAAADAGELAFGTMDSWMVWNLTGGARGGRHVTDVTNASRTQLMNLATLDWDESLLETFRIPRGLLPQIVSSSAQIGVCALESFAGVPITGILGDQQAALVGQCCFAPGEAKNTYGTGCFLLLNTGQRIVPSRTGLITTVAYRFGDAAPAYALEGSIANTGALVQWLRDGLKIIDSAPQVETLAREVEDNGGVYIVPAFSGLYAPHWNAGARGAVLGLTRYATRAHIARAALEATAFQVQEVLESMQHDAGMALHELRVDGGMVANQLLMQFQADMLDRAVLRTPVAETTALGAAYAAGLAVGYWQDIDALRANWRESQRWVPGMDGAHRERLAAQWRKAVGRTLDWVESPPPTKDE